MTSSLTIVITIPLIFLLKMDTVISLPLQSRPSIFSSFYFASESMDLVGKVSFFFDLLCFEPKISTWARLFLLSFVVVTGTFGNIITVWFRRKLSEVGGLIFHC